MPELPEVQTVVAGLAASGLLGATIRHTHVHWPRTIDRPSPHAFAKRVHSATIADVARRGKFIVVTLGNGLSLLVHLRMTGRFDLVRSDAPHDEHERVVFELDHLRELRFHDTRKFGRMYLVSDPAEILGQLGPEPLSDSFTSKWLHHALHAKHRMLKPLLLDQTFIAGLGNIYVDESLWDARLHPRRRSDSLTWHESRHLHRGIRRALRKGVRNLGTALGRGETNFRSLSEEEARNQEELNVFQRTGEDCPRCKTPVKRIIVGQRSTHICPACQSESG
jgi:formamidopyrimidine-DNA glycosylase